MPTTTLILGGGVGGVVAAHTLRGKLPAAHRIVLFDRARDHLFAPSLLWLLVGDRTPEQIVRPLDRLQRKGIEVVHADIDAIDPAARTVTAAGQTWHGDHLIVALGAQLDASGCPGLAEAGHTFYTLDGARQARDAVRAFRGGRVVVLTAAPAYKCPVAPYEAAMLVEAHLRARKLAAPWQVDVYAAEAAPMGVAGPAAGAAVCEMLAGKGIGYFPQHQVTAVESTARSIRFENGAVADFDLLLYVPPHRAPAVVRAAGMCADSGWIAVDRLTLATRWPGVWALGDVTSIPLALGKPLPKAGVFAHGQADAVATNLARAVLGKGKAAVFDGTGECFIETGDGRAALGRGKFFAEPLPEMTLHEPSHALHLAKVVFEKGWLRRWF
ncbi:MAG: NAD(P)/FAD-dependent oxidoreductase [Myxococcales bacterium]|nr:NAD(P)/FAD-dependent oxidoreductase [Myxococcales bacterium]